jgi:hypothetical protein
MNSVKLKNIVVTLHQSNFYIVLRVNFVLELDVTFKVGILSSCKYIEFVTLDRHLMWRREFDTSYVGFMKDGAQWLVDNTDIKFVGK